MGLSDTAAIGPTPSVTTTGLVVVSVIFPILSFISLVFRNSARRKSRQLWRPDDAWAVAAWVGL
jgi:hypothetical protein